MTDYSTADAVAAAFAEARPILAGAFHTDDYSLVRRESIPDGRGGSTTADVTVEVGRCSLTAASRIGTEGASGDAIIAISQYTAELPAESIAGETDLLGFAGRLFGITDVKRGGAIDLFTVAELEERT